MGDPQLDLRRNKAGSDADHHDAPPVPGRGTLVSHAPTTVEGMAMQQLRVATGALVQLRTVWLPLLEGTLPHGMPAPGNAALDARAALIRAESAIAQAGLLRGLGWSADLESLWATTVAERDALRPRVEMLVAANNVLTAARAAPAAPAPAPAAPAPGGPAPAAPSPTPAPAAPAHTGALPTPTATATRSAPPAIIPGPAYAPTWETIAKAAAGDAGALAALDVEWIDGLHPLIVSGIDVGFTRGEVEAAFAQEVASNAGIAKLDGDHKQQSAQHYADVKKQRQAAHEAVTDAAIRGDAAWQGPQGELDHAHDAARTQAVADLRAKFDAKKHAVHHAQNVAEPPKEGVTNAEGRLLARANFMSWASHILGSPAGVKQHYRAVRPVSKIKDVKNPLLLWGPAATRLEQAWDWFEHAYPGNTFFQTDVGFGLRGVHHESHPLSYLGHALGFSVDFRAYDNPSFLKDGVGMFMLRRFGGHDEGGKYVYGNSKMDMPANAYETIIAMGKASERGEDVSTQGEDVIAKAGAAYDKMTRTSDNVRASLGGGFEELKVAKAKWIDVNGPLKQKLVAAEKAVAAAQVKAAKELAKTLPKDASKEDKTRAIEEHADVVAAVKARDEAAQELEAAKAAVKAAMDKALAPWVKALEADQAEEHKLADAEAGVAIDLKAAGRLRDQVAATHRKPELEAILASKVGKQVFDADAMAAITDAKALREAMLARAAAVFAAKNADGELTARDELLRRLRDPQSVFGTVGYNKWRKTFATELRADAPPIMQILELGFARHDELAGADHAKDPKQVFNREFIQTMMRFGWNTGADWGAIDTMHFDFLEAFSGLAGSMNFYSTNYGPKP